MTNSNPAPHPGESFSEYRERLRAFGVKMPTEKMIKTPKEIEGCREAGRINSLVLDRVEREISVGMSTADIDERKLKDESFSISSFMCLPMLS